MKNLGAVVLFLVPTLAFAADGPVGLGANGGKFGDWTAASYGSGADKACYAFVAASHSDPVLNKRGDVMLTVTQRHGARDEVTLSAGYTYPPKAVVTLIVGSSTIDFYTQGGTAFTVSGKNAVAAFKNGATAETKSSAPGGKTVTDDFSLSGFSGAYSAITTACP
jgi:hypothetical protein